MKYAILQSGSEQLRVEEGSVVTVDKLPEEPGSRVEFSAVLVSDEGGVQLGTPVLEGVSVKGTVLGHGRASKVRVFKYKPRKRYRRTQGHRQDFTRVRIDEIAL